MENNITYEHKKCYSLIKKIISELIRFCNSFEKNSIFKIQYEKYKNEINIFLKNNGIVNIKSDINKFAKYINETIKTYTEMDIIDINEDIITIDNVDKYMMENMKIGYYPIVGINLLSVDIFPLLTDEKKELIINIMNKINYWGTIYIKKAEMIYEYISSTDKLMYLCELVYGKKIKNITRKTIIKRIEAKLRKNPNDIYMQLIHNLILSNIPSGYNYIDPENIKIKIYKYKHELDGLYDHIKVNLRQNVDKNENISNEGIKYKKTVSNTVDKLLGDVVETLDKKGYHTKEDMKKKIFNNGNIEMTKGELTDVFKILGEKTKLTLKNKQSKIAATDAAMGLLDDLQMNDITDGQNGEMNMITDTLKDIGSEFKKIFNERKHQIKNNIKINKKDQEKMFKNIHKMMNKINKKK